MNEMNSLKSLFGNKQTLTIWVDRFDHSSSSHETENNISRDDCDIVLSNRKSELDLQLNIYRTIIIPYLE